MAENKYRKYLNSDDDHSRFSFSDTINKVAMAGGILAGAAGAYKGLKYLNGKGEFDTIKKDVVRGMSFLSKKATLAEGYLTGLNATIKQSGLLRTITGGADEALEANLKKSLVPGIIGESGGLEGTPTRFMKQLYESSLAKRETAKSVIQNVRLDKVLEEFRTKVGNDDIYNSFEGLLRTKGNVLSAGWGGKGNRNKVIANALNNAVKELELDLKFDGSTEFTSARAELTNILAKTGNKQKFVNENKDVIKGQISAINKAYDDAMIADLNRHDTTSDSIVSKTLAFGFRRMTVGDAVKNETLRSAVPFKEVIIKNAAKYGTSLGREGLDPHNMAVRALQRNPALADAAIDPLVFINKAGDTLDLRWMRRTKDKALNTLSNNVQVPFIGIRPFKLLSIVNKQSVDNMPKFNLFRRGTLMPSINNSLDRLKDDYYYFAGRLIDKSGSVVEEDGYLPSAHFGIPQRVASSMAGISRKEIKEPEGFWGHVGRLFDIGNQEFESDITRKASVATKWFDPNYGRNIWKKVSKKGSLASVSEDDLQKAYSNFMNVVENNSTALDRDTLVAIKDYLEPVVGKDIVNQLINEPQAEGTMNAIHQLVARSDAKDLTLGPLRNKDALRKTLNRYTNNPDAFDRPVRTVKKGYHIPIESIDATNTELVSSLDEAQKLLHTEILNLVQIRTSNVAGKTYTVGDMAKELVENSSITKGQAEKIKDLHLLGELKGLADTDGNLTKNGFKSFSDMVVGEKTGVKEVHEHLRKTVFKANPILGEGPGEKPENAFSGNDFLFMKRAKFNPIQVINEITRQGGNIDDKIKAIAQMTVGQLGFGPQSIRAGRGNLQAVTTATQAAYYYAFRLNEGLAKVGLGLGREHLGSTQDIVTNLFMRRLLGPAAVAAGIGYLNYESGNVIGEKPNQLGAEAYARMSLDVAWLKDVTGINAMSKHLGRIMPGSDKLWQNPIGMAMKFGTFGLLGEDRSYDDLKRYYEKGYEPIRKGRYWSWGSSTPFYGGRIEYFAPSWYRQAMGDPMMTDVMYGSEGEYWGNHWLPNPRNPLGIFKTVINPYHWENKHRLDRPYPVTGGIQPIEEIPLVGPLFSGTIGNILKPPREYHGLAKAHRDYLREINEKYKEYAGQGAGGAMLLVSPGGRITPVTYSNGSEYVGEGGDYSGYGGGLPGAVSAGVPGEGGVRVVDPTAGFTQQAGSYINRQELTAINKGIVDKAYLKPIDTRSIQQLRDNVFVDNLDAAMDPNSPAYRLSETWYSMTEIGGIYGFAANSIFGEMAPRTILQSSSRMTSMSRSFWDERLGGMGGEFSEIYRRFVPNWRSSVKQYNPIRNTMPDWMPGVEYFTDFKHGDPYVKIPKGEMRLPGAGYEAINKLHPDFFGQYGALDRFKILGDIAPWSEQYQYYNRVVSKMYQAGMMNENDYTDVQEMREMVRDRKKKYDLYPYKFKYADIIKKTVTVTQWIDNQTFLTKEMPGTPIRMAGIKVSDAADSPEAEEAKNAIREHIKTGEKIRIGLEKDPLNRVRDDVMGTMHAVVYDNYGGPLQARLVRANVKGIKANYDDKSAVASNALYEGNMITLGKVWEEFAHMDTPFHTKFLQIRSPLEHYKRQLLYGKEWQSWSHPIRDWVKPTIDKLSSQNPIYASVMGAGIGWLFGVWGRSKKAGALIGALVGGISSSVTVGKEVINRTVGMNPEYTWLPKRRIIERDVDEYFDMLKYVKYRGLYEKTRQLAIHKEGIDPEDIVKYAESKGKQTSKTRRYIENVKRWLKIGTGTGMLDDEESKVNYQEFNNRLTQVGADNLLVEAGPLALKALQYRQEYQSTLYGADPNGDMTTIYRALPKKDRPFFKEFMLASPEEREEILRLVPKNQRRFYQAKWGLNEDGKQSLGAYFKNHNLPGANWAGWRPDVSLEEVKLKFVNNEALEMGEFGFWEDDMKYAKSAPELPDIKKNGLDFLDVAQLHKVLNGMGIRNADILVTTEVVETPDNLFGVDVDLMHDRREDALNAINENFATLLAE